MEYTKTKIVCIGLRLIILTVFHASLLNSQECRYPLGMESYDIDDYQLSASDITETLTTFAPVWNARMNNNKYFTGHTNGRETYHLLLPNAAGHWLQLDLLVPHKITEMAVQGAKNSHQQIELWKLKFSEDMETWHWYNDLSGTPKILPEDGPYTTWLYNDPSTAKTVNISNIIARGIRFYPVSVLLHSDIRLEFYGCTLGVDHYTKYENQTSNMIDIAKTTDTSGSLMFINTSTTYAITSVAVSGEMVKLDRFEMNTSVSVYYKKPGLMQTWRQVPLANYSASGNEVILSFGYAVKGTQLKLLCNAAVLDCTNFTAIFGSKLNSCPNGFVEFYGNCYKHIPFKQTMSNNNERGICQRMSWSDGVYMAAPTSLNEIVFLKHLSKRSGTQTGSHLGIHRGTSTLPWLDQSGLPIKEPFFWASTSTASCAVLHNLVNPTACTTPLPFTCKTKAEGEGSHNGCDWIVTSDRKISSTTDKKVVSGIELTECMWYCQNEKSFLCKSIEWRYIVNECRLNKFNADSPGVTLAGETYTDLYDYYCVEDPNCFEPLLFRNGTKQNVTFTASSTNSLSHLDNIRLDRIDYPNNGDYWYPASNTEPYFQVEFRDVTKVHKLIMMGGSYKYNGYVTKFYTLYSNITDLWNRVTDNLGQLKAFTGPTNRYSQAKHMFVPALVAKLFRFDIVSFYWVPAMRMELYGCTLYSENIKGPYWPYNSLGMDSYTQHDIENYQLSAQHRKGYPSTYYPPWQARYKNDPNIMLGLEKSFWAGSIDQSQWFQVDFLTVHKIVGFSMIGGGSADFKYFTTKFKVQYSAVSPIKFDILYDEIGNEKIFPGQFRYDVGIYTPFDNYTIKARFFRIVTTQVSGSPYQRFEFYGEPAVDDCPTLDDNSVNVTSSTLDDNSVNLTALSGQCVCDIAPSSDEFIICLNSEKTTKISLQFRTVFLVHGIEIVFQPTTQNNDSLDAVNFSYLHPGNSSWSKYWYRVNKESGKAVYQGQRMIRALQIRIDIPPSISNITTCAAVKVYGYQAPACPLGFVLYNRNCYQIPESIIQMWDSSKYFNWDLVNMCQKMTWNGTAVLGTLTNLEESDFVYKLAKRQETIAIKIYIGYIAPNISITPFDWVWIDGSPSMWMNWDSGQPDEAVGERCTVMGYGTDPLSFHDDLCTRYYQYFCKVDALDHICKYNGDHDVNCTKHHQYCKVDALDYTESNSSSENSTTTSKPVYEWAMLPNKRSSLYAKIENRLEVKDHTLSQCLSLCESGLAWSNCTAVDYYATGKACYLSTANERENTFVTTSLFDFYYLGVLKDDCMAPLVWPNYPGQVDVSASTRISHTTDVRYADLNDYTSYWRPTDTNTIVAQYIQVDFHSIAKVVKFSMRGCVPINWYVTGYNILYTNDTRWWEYYQNERGEPLNFIGNNNKYEVHTRYFTPAIYGRFIRINPNSAFGGICMNFELYGCITAKDTRNDCRAVLRGSAFNDVHQFAYIELNGHPYVRYHKTFGSGHAGFHLLTVDPDLCQADLISTHLLFTDTINQNRIFRERISSLQNGTVLFGVTNIQGETVDAQTKELLRALHLDPLALYLGGAYKTATSIMTLIGDPTSSDYKLTSSSYGPAMMVKSLQYSHTHGDYSKIDIPDRLAHWPFTSQHGLKDISENNLHFEMYEQGVQIKKDEGTFDHPYVNFDGTGYLRADINGSLHMANDMTIFYAMNQNSDKTLLTFHDSVLTGFKTLFTLKLYTTGYSLQIQKSSTDIVMNGAYTIDAKVWSFLAITFNSQTNRLRVWKNGIVVADTIVSGNFSQATNTKYLTVGYNGGYFVGKLACLQFFNESLTSVQIQKLIHECRGRKDILKDVQKDIWDHQPVDMPLGMMDGFISESQTKVSSHQSVFNYVSHKNNLRLYSTSVEYLDSGCWIAATTTDREWIQIDLGILHEVSGLVYQGCPCVSGYVKSVLVEYTVDSNWTVLLPTIVYDNKTISLNQDWDLAVKSDFPEIVETRNLRLWLHQASSYTSGSLEVLGKPINLLPLTKDEVDSINIVASSSCTKLHIEGNTSYADIESCGICQNKTSNSWWSLDLKRLFYVTSVVIKYETQFSNHRIKFEKRYIDTEWKDLSENPYLKQIQTNSTVTESYHFAPVVRTRFLKIMMIDGNVSCLNVTLHGEKTPTCPPGSIINPVNKKCIHYNVQEYAPSQTSKMTCEMFNWATTGREIVTNQQNIKEFALYLYNGQNGRIGMTHTGDVKTAFWVDGTSAHPVEWHTASSAPILNEIAFIGGNSIYYDSSKSSATKYICETNSSEYTAGIKLTVTAIGSFKLFVDGDFKGERSWWNYPWILALDHQPKVLAVEVTITSSVNPGILSEISDGSVSDSSWKCTNKWESLWAEPGFNDSHWENATEIELHSESTRVLNYGFEGNINKTYWIWTRNHTSPIDLHVYCRKSFSFNTEQTDNETESCSWVYWDQLCPSEKYRLAVIAGTLIECIEICQSNTSIRCVAVDYYKSTGKCYLRTAMESNIQIENFVVDTGCYHMQMWCTDCSKNLIQDMYRQGMVSITASSIYSTTYPATNGILNNYNLATRVFDYWWAGIHNVYQWIEAQFTNYINMTAIKIQSHVYTMRQFHVYYTHPANNTYMVIRHKNGGKQIFYGNHVRMSFHATNVLRYPVVTKTVRINPRSWVSYISLNFDIVGCIVKDYNPDAENWYTLDDYWHLGMASKDIGLTQITASTSSVQYMANYGRFSSADFPNEKCWLSGTISTSQFLQVDLLIEHDINGILYQGCKSMVQFVTGIRLKYSSDGNTWSSIFKEDGITEIVYVGDAYFNGNFPGQVLINGTITARHLRVITASYYSRPGLRIEILGKTKDCAGIFSPNIIGVNGTEGITNHNLDKSMLDIQTTSSQPSWCPNIANYSSKPKLVVELDSLYHVTSLDFLNLTDVIKVQFAYSHDGQNWKVYYDERIKSPLITVQGRTNFRFQRLLSLKIIELTIEEWDIQPCLQVLIRGCKAAACPPNSIQQGNKCYYHNYESTLNYEKSLTECQDFRWAGNGYPVMPKDWKSFDFLQALITPNKLYMNRRSYIGLQKKNGFLVWADNENVTEVSKLPFYSSPTSECVAIGYNFEKLTTVGCTSSLDLFCEVQSSVSLKDNRILWFHRWNVFSGNVIFAGIVKTPFDCMTNCVTNTTSSCNSVRFYRYIFDNNCYQSSNSDFGKYTTYAHDYFHHYERYNEEPCEKNLLDSNINFTVNVSSSYNTDSGPEYIVYSSDFSTLPPKYWRPADTDLERWIRFDFGGFMLVKHIFYAGAQDLSYWTDEIIVSSSVNGEWFEEYYLDPKSTDIAKKVLTYGYSLSRSWHADAPLVYPFVTRYLQLTIKSFTGKPALRLAIYGCEIDNDYIPDCFRAMGMESGIIKPSQMSSSSAYVTPAGAWYNHFNAATDSSTKGYEMAGWIPRPVTDVVNSFIEVTFQGVYNITYIITQGIGTSYVTKFDIHSSKDRITWVTTRSDGTVMSYPGTLNKIMHILVPYLEASSIRIYPKAYSVQVALKLEFVGCSVDCPILSTDGQISSGWKEIQPCSSDGSAMCSKWCPNNNGSIEINILFGTNFFLTGFMLQSQQEINITNDEIWIKDAISRKKQIQVIKKGKRLNMTENMWEWKLMESVVLSSLEMNVFASNQSECVELEIHACSVDACPVGFVQYAEYCYYFRDIQYKSPYEYKGLDIHTAEKTCEDMSWGSSGKIPLPQTTELTYFLQHIALPTTGKMFLNVQYNNITQSYTSSGATLEYTRWDSVRGHPNPAYGNCVNMIDGFWQGSSCDHGKTMCQTRTTGKLLHEWIYAKAVAVSGSTAWKTGENIRYMSSCLQICEKEELCKSVQYDPATMQCILYRENRYDLALSLITGTKTYSEKLPSGKCSMELLKTFGYQITSSSDFDALHSKDMLIMDKSTATPAGGFWKPATNDVNQWIQITFTTALKLWRLITIGTDFVGTNSQITQFKLKYSLTLSKWNYVTNEIDNTEVFKSLTGYNGLTQFLFSSPPYGKGFRIEPTAWLNNIALQIKMFGCAELVELNDCGTLAQPESLKCYKNWNIIMEHTSGESDFNTSWSNYTNGFHNALNGEYYTGNSMLHSLTKVASYVMRLDMWKNSDFMYAEFDNFQVLSELKEYEIFLDDFIAGTAGEGGLLNHSSAKFYTRDVMNNSCAVEHSAGFWYLNSGNTDNTTNNTSDSGVCYESVLTGYPVITWKNTTNNELISVSKVIMRMQAKIEPINVAFRKNTFMSSTSLQGYDSSKAVDGYRFYNPLKESCAVTLTQDNPYWLVDLEKDMTITHLLITTSDRNDSLNNFDVKVSRVEPTPLSPNLAMFQLCQHYSGALPAKSTVSLNCTNVVARYLAIQMVGTMKLLELCEVEVFSTFKVEMGLGEDCSWDADCSVSFSQCLPSDPSAMALHFQCQCQKYYKADNGQCKPVVDLSLHTDFHESVILRGVLANFTFNLDIINHDPRDVWSVKPPDFNFNITVRLVDNDITLVPAGYEISYSTSDYLLETLGAGVNRSSNLTLQIDHEILITPEECSHVKYLCLELAQPRNASYFESNYSNNVMCVESLNIVLCKPEIDVIMKTAVYSSSTTIVRDLPEQQSFSISLQLAPGSFAIVDPGIQNKNFVIKYMFSPENIINGSLYIDDLSLVTTTMAMADAQKSINTPNVINVMAHYAIDIDYSKCNPSKFICMFLTPHPSATFYEKNFTNNVKCIDIELHKNCTPELPISVTTFTLSTPEIVRGYNISTSISINLKNNHNQIPVSPLSDLSMNYNVSMFLTDQGGVNNGIVKKYKVDIPIVQLQQNIQPSSELTLNGAVTIFIPRAGCELLKYFCVEVVPDSSASYQLFPGNQHIHCIDTAGKINCLGVEIGTVTFTNQPKMIASPNSVVFSVAWLQGTDVNYIINFGDGSDLYQWNWQNASHTEAFGPHTNDVSHIFEEIGNYTIELKIWNEVHEKINHSSVIAEPYLDNYVNFSAIYTPGVVPLNVAIRVNHVKPYLNKPIWMICTEDYGYTNQTSNFQFTDTYELTHILTKDEPNRDVTVTCENHVSSTNYSVTIILRENITGLSINSEKPAYATNGVATFFVTMSTGSHALLTIDYGDQTSRNYSNVDIHSSDFTWIVNHTYVASGNYTVTVYAENEHFSSLNETLIIIQNPVPDVKLQAEANIKYPDGIASFTLQPLDVSVLPDNVFCLWRYNNYSESLYYSISLMSGLPNIQEYIYNRTHVGSQITVEVACFNLVNTKKTSIIVQVFEETNMANVLVNQESYAPNQIVTFELTLNNGSNVVYDIDFGDGKNETYIHPNIFASSSSLFVSHSYTAIGNYSVVINASNPVSYTLNTEPQIIIVQNKITNITASANKSVIWPPGMVDFVIASGFNQKNLHNIFCDFMYSETVREVIYFETIDFLTPVRHSFEFPKSFIGSVNMTVGCNNLISHTNLSVQFELIFDEIILESLTTSDWIWWTNTSIFNLTMTRFASHSCFLWDTGDGNKFLYGLPWCQTSAQSQGYQLIPITDQSQLLQKSHVYDTWGIYKVTVFAYNHVSNATLSQNAVVKEWYCYTPNITYPKNLTDSSIPAVFNKGYDFSVVASVDIDCMKSFNRSESWLRVFDITQTAGNPVLQWTNITTLNYKRRSLQYGRYTAVLKVIMLGVPDKFKEAQIYFDIVKTPLDVNIPGSYNLSINLMKKVTLDAFSVSFDHDIDPAIPQGLKFEWSCRQITEEIPVDSNGQIVNSGPGNASITTFEDFKGCFGGGPGILNETSGILKFNTGFMMPDKTYVFVLKATKDTRVSIAEKLLTVLPAAPPNVTFVCRDNCGPIRRLSTSMIITTTCTEFCKTKFGSINYLWEMEFLNSTTGKTETYANLSTISLTGDGSQTLYLKPWSLFGGLNHAAVLTVWTPGSERGVFRYSFQSNLPPYGGTCSINPLEGFASQTLFEFTCMNWKEFPGPGKKNELKYEYKVKSLGADRAFLVYYGNNPASDPSFLPVGNYTEGFTNEMELYIVDTIGDYYRLVKPVITKHPYKPKSELAAELLGDINDKSSSLQQAYSSKNYKLLSSIVFSTTSLLNVPVDLKITNHTEDTGALIKQRKEIRSSLINMMSDVPVESLDSLVQINDVIRTLLLQANEVSVDSQIVAVNKLSDMTDSFIAMKGNVTNDKKKQISTDLGSSTVRVILAGDFALSESAALTNGTDTVGNSSESNMTSFDKTSAKVGQVMKTAISVTTKITNSLVEDKEVGDPVDIIDLGEMTLMVDKSTGTSISNSQFSSQHGNINLPDLQKLLPGSNGDCVSSELMFASVNPFIWDASSSDVNSNVASFQLTDCSNTTSRKKRAVNQDLSYEVDLKVSKSPQVNSVNETLQNPDGILFHSLNLSSIPKPVTLSVYPVTNESLKVFIGYNEKPNTTNYADYFEVPNANMTVTGQSELDDSAYTMYLEAGNLTSNNVSQIHIAVMKNGCFNGATCKSSQSNSITYTYRLSEVQCQMWDNVLEIWTSDGCEVQPGSTPTKIRFKSNLFGSMGAGVFVGPNTIDFSSVFDNIGQKFADNAAVVGTVIAVIIVYIVIVVICRRLDKKDTQKWKILPLSDNNPLDETVYEVHVYTGLLSNAGTDSNVKMILAGTDSDTGFRQLNDGMRKNFQRGDVNSFLMRTPCSLGIPVTLKIWHDNSGKDKKAGWYLSKVVIVDLLNDKWYLFMCEDWLSVEESGYIEGILKLASTDDLAEKGGALLQNNIKKKLFDDHIWLSVGYRSVRSTFTRVQRLSCCLAILFLTMVSNAMWYGTGEAESNQAAFTIGPISFTVHQLYTSLMSSLIVVPPVLIITVLFSKSGDKVKKKTTGSNYNDATLNAKGALEREEGRGKNKKKLPYWCIFFAYLLVVLSAVAGAFFTILYAFQWGKEKSQAWLITFLLSFFQSVMFIQPIKVIIVAAVLTYLFKKDSDTSDYEDQYGKMENRDDDLSPANKDILSSTMTLSQEEIETAQQNKMFKQKLSAMLKEIVWNVLFLALLMYVVVGNQDGNVFLQNNDLRNRFMSGTKMVSTKDQLWGWFQKVLLPSLYNNQDYNSKPVSPYDTRFIDNGYAMRLGPPRLRQLRVKPEKCEIFLPMTKVTKLCKNEFAMEFEDQRNYSTFWQSVLNPNESVLVTGSSEAFLYTTPKQMDGIMYWGNVAWYPSGGYVVNLENELTIAADIINNLNNSGWIDEFTRVVMVEFNVWNANTNLFNMFMLSFELFEFGGVITWLNLDSINLYRYAGPSGLLNLLVEVILTIVVLAMTIKYIINAVKSRGQFCKEFWNIVTLICYVLYFTSLGIYVWRSLLTVQKVEEMMNNKGKSVNFQLLVLANTLFLNFLSLMTFLWILRLTHIMRYNKTFAVMGETLAQSVRDMFGIFVTFGIIFLAFTALCYTLFQSYLKQYSTIQVTMGTLSSAFLGVFDYVSVVQAFGVFGGIVILIYLMVMMLLIMNIFVALLNQFLNTVQQNPECLPKDYEVAEYFMKMLKTTLSKEKKPKHHVTASGSGQFENIDVGSMTTLVTQTGNKHTATYSNSKALNHDERKTPKLSKQYSESLAKQANDLLSCVHLIVSSEEDFGGFKNKAEITDTKKRRNSNVPKAVETLLQDFISWKQSTNEENSTQVSGQDDDTGSVNDIVQVALQKLEIDFDDTFYFPGTPREDQFS